MRTHLNRLKNALETGCLFLFDMLSVLVLFKLAVIARTHVLPLFYSGFPEELNMTVDPVQQWWMFLVWAFFFFYDDIYSRKLSFWDEMKALWKAAFFASVGVFAIASVGKLHDTISRTVVVLMCLIAVPALPMARMGFKRILRSLGFLQRRVLILGAGETGRMIARALRKEPNYGYLVVGYLDDDPGKSGSSLDGVKVHRGVDSAEKYIQHCNITDVIIAMPGAGRERLQGLLHRLQHQAEHILFVPDFLGMAVTGMSLLHFFEEQAFALEFQNNLARPLNYITKRIFDYVVGVIIFIVLALPLLVIALIIRMTSEGPASYGQSRMGKDGRPFKCYKFRTMYKDADKRLNDILEHDPLAREEWELHFKLKNDPRVTPIGRFLRMTSLDELLQIFNVLRGDMSLVGPRPVTQVEIDEYYKEQAKLCFCVLPGITGLWQVSGRSNTSYDYRIALDSWYVRNWNLWLDIVIMIKTVGAVIRKEGAF